LGSPLDKLLRSAKISEEILAMLATPGFVRPEQWQAQIQALYPAPRESARLQFAFGRIDRAAHLTPCHDISAAVRQALAAYGTRRTVAVYRRPAHDPISRLIDAFISQVEAPSRLPRSRQVIRTLVTFSENRSRGFSQELFCWITPSELLLMSAINGDVP